MNVKSAQTEEWVAIMWRPALTGLSMRKRKKLCTKQEKKSMKERPLKRRILKEK